MHKVLIVEDNAQLLEIYRQVLELDNYEVHTVTNVTEAMQIAEKIRLSVIVLDVRLATVSGAVLLDYVKRHPRLKSIPCLVVSGDVDAVKSDLRFRQAERILPKPVSGPDLLAAVEELARATSRPA